MDAEDFRAQVQRLLDKECEVDWGPEGKFWGIVSKYDATHPAAPWTIFYPGDEDEENGVFKRDFTEWHVEDEEHPNDEFTKRQILRWKDGTPQVPVPQQPKDLDTSTFEPALGRRPELPHNQSSESGSDASSESEDGGSSDRERPGSRGGRGGGKAAATGRPQLKQPARRALSDSGAKPRRGSAGPSDASQQQREPQSQPGKEQLAQQPPVKRKPGRPRKHPLPEGGAQPPSKRPKKRQNDDADNAEGGGSGAAAAAAADKADKPKQGRLRKQSGAPVNGGGGAATGGRGSAEPEGAPAARRMVRLDSDELDDGREREGSAPPSGGGAAGPASDADGGGGRKSSQPLQPPASTAGPSAAKADAKPACS
ncbi:hypothetical protein GPECTOR_25g392 [Gonium pectorale]|uniref:Uncharacterized protein n=1 Tax=Gonium pectorale TaxID=33097 RepID=A0A150GG44_GONPE|nr:hypothetical protein GPECTOR_25g392 [Gonium pectorale]|eukprot:KXZ48808.1 hypothetical protein GPECTOR_25g392 [Gonium pectorale]